MLTYLQDSTDTVEFRCAGAEPLIMGFVVPKELVPPGEHLVEARPRRALDVWLCSICVCVLYEESLVA